MKKNRFFEFLKSPNGIFLIIVYLLTLATVAASLICVATDFSAPAVYVVYAAAAITLSYSVYTLVRMGKKMKKKISSVADKYSFTKKFVHDYGFRSSAFAFVSFVVNAAYAVFEAIMGIVFRSVWYGALSGYHFALGALRFAVLRGARKADEGDEEKKIDPRRHTDGSFRKEYGGFFGNHDLCDRRIYVLPGDIGRKQYI